MTGSPHPNPRPGHHARPPLSTKPAAPPELGSAECSFVADCMFRAAPDWSVELNRAFRGEASLVIMPPGVDDAIGPTFVIHRSGQGFRLDRFQWDEYGPIGAFATLRATANAVRACIVALRANLPASTLRH
jgi:hypothetical protein